MDTPIVGNPDPYPGAHGGDAGGCAEWLAKDAAIRAEGNQSPFPRHGDGAAQAAWYARDAEIRKAAKTETPTVSPSAPVKPDADLDPDGPVDVDLLKKMIGALSPDARESYLMRLLVSSRHGGLPGPIIIAAQQMFYEAQVNDLMRENSELFEQLRSERAERSRSETEIIDALADKLFNFTKSFIVSETKERVAALQKKVITKSAQIRNEADAIEQLHARSVLLDGRIRFLELQSPIWVTVNTEG